MNVKREESRMIKRAGAIILALFVVFMLAHAFGTGKVSAHDEVNDIKITVGYWGGKDYTKKEVSLSKLASSCGTCRRIYTWINAGNAPGVTEAEGIMLSDIMQYCGIDMDSVYYFNFYSVDAATYANSNQQWTLEQLFGERVTYEKSFRKVVKDYDKDREDFVANPENHYTVEDVFDFSELKYTDKAWNEAETIEPMLALKSSSSTWKSYIPQSRLDYSGLSDTGRPILMFGQAGRNDITRNLMAQMVNKIHIWFEGTPEIEISDQDFNSEVGSKKKIGVSVRTPDEYLSKQIAGSVSFKSSNSDVAEVDDKGNVEIKGKGTAEITAVYDGKKYGKITATGTAKKKKEKEGGNGSGSGEGSGNGSGSGNGGSGSGAGSGDNNGSSGGSGGKDARSAGGSGNNNNISLSENSRDNDSTKSDSKETAKGTLTASSSRNNGNKNSSEAGGGTAGSTGAQQKLYEIQKASADLANDPDATYMIKWIVLLAAAALTAGVIKQSVYFRSQVNWIGKAKRAYERT